MRLLEGHTSGTSSDEEPPPEKRSRPLSEVDLSRIGHIVKGIMEQSAGVSRKSEGDSDEDAEDVQLSSLLAYCGLNLDEMDELPPIWRKLRRVKNKGTKDLLVRKFWTDLATTRSPELHGSVSAELMEAISTFKLAGDLRGGKPHVGFGPLGFVARDEVSDSAHMEALEAMERASAVTVTDVLQHKRGPPPLPTTPDAILNVIRRCRAGTVGLFTTRSQLTVGINEVYHEYSRQVSRLRAIPSFTVQYGRDIMFALCEGYETFLSQVVTAEDLEDPTFALPNPFQALTEAIRNCQGMNYQHLPQYFRAQAANPRPAGETRSKVGEDPEDMPRQTPASRNAGPTPPRNNPTYSPVFKTWKDQVQARQVQKLNLYRLARTLELPKDKPFPTIAGRGRHVCVPWDLLGQCHCKSDAKKQHPQTPPDVASAKKYLTDTGLDTVASKYEEKFPAKVA